MANQILRIILGHRSGCGIDRQDALIVSSYNDACRCMVKDDLRKLLAFCADTTLGDIRINGDKTTVVERCTADVEGLAVGSGALEMVCDGMTCAGQ